MAKEYAGHGFAVEALFWKAGLLNSARDEGGAIDVHRNIAETYRQYPEAVKAREMWGERLLILKKPEEAIAVLEPVRDAGKDGSSPYLSRNTRKNVLRRLIQANLRAGHPNEAERAFQELLAADPKESDSIRTWYKDEIRRQLRREEPK